MQNLTVREVCLSWASGRRRHSSGGLTDLYPPQVSHLSTGDNYIAAPPAATIGTKVFSLMILSGGSNGPKFYTADDLANQTPVPDVMVGSADISVVSIYLEPGGPGTGGGPALCIDAFNITTGVFIDDDFVNVLHNGVVDPSLSASVNYDGVVDSSEAGFDVRAYNNFVTVYAPAGVQEQFNKWQSIDGTEPVSMLDITVTQGETAYYLALYTTPAPVRYTVPKNNAELWQWVSYATMVDGNPHYPMGPELGGFIAALAFATNLNSFSKELRPMVAEIAAKQIMLSAEGMARQIMEGAEKGE